jgi:alpha-galactosidase/6-phospho-beta-glucosidase family protein
VKVAFVGAGCTVFAKTLIGNLLSYPELADAEIHELVGLLLEAHGKLVPALS